ncbi:hypothetical protein VV1062A_01516 [Vibrio vulnificus]|nr:hypothetical protein VFL11327_03812 [Vibrio fluvialis]OJI56490.1 hypothetical protein VV1062A_01516 [Vibrio vulnificus]
MKFMLVILLQNHLKEGIFYSIDDISPAKVDILRAKNV